MRVDGLGVRDVGEVPGGASDRGHPTGVDDGGRARGQRVAGMVFGHSRSEHGTSREPGRHGVDVSDGAWVEHGAGGTHIEGTRGAHGVRVDGVGVGDVGEVSGGAWRRGDSACSADCRIKGWERDTGMVVGRGHDERRPTREPRLGTLCIDDGAWVEHGAGVAHEERADGAHGVRVDGVGVGDVGEVQGRTWGVRHAAGDDDGRG